MRTRRPSKLLTPVFVSVMSVGWLAFGAAAGHAQPVPEPAAPPPSADHQHRADGSGEGSGGGMHGPGGGDKKMRCAGGDCCGGGGTDHDQVVGLWGVEVKQIGVGYATPDLTCKDDGCRVQLNALGVRRWVSDRYAWTAGLVLAFGGGGERRTVNGVKQSLTRDTYFGVGPSVGAVFMLREWRHLTVNLNPQVDFVYFAPSSSGRKTMFVNAGAVVEAELHLGMIGVPALSLGTSAGLMANLRLYSSTAATDETSREWSLGTTAPTSLWGMATNVFVRYYF